MNEKIVTILLGLGLGIILAAAILFTVPKSTTNPQTIPVVPSTSPTSPTTSTSLIIDSPLDNFWATESPITVSGKTLPNVLVILTGPADEISVDSNNDGLFTAKLKIEEGENNILAVVRDSSGKFITAKKSVTLEIKSE
ncbi:MAG: hypothetical protein AAB506_01310 [Patescibacteria group bacterium]